MIKSVLVLGATGKSGRRIIPQLQARGIEVRAASRKSGEGRVAFDWDRPETHDAALAGVGAVYLITPDGVEDSSAVVGPFLQRAAAAGVGRVVAVSSMGVEFPNEQGDSGRHKLEAQIKVSGLDWTILRPGGFSQNFSEDFLLPGVMRGMVATATGEGKVAFVDAADIAAVAVAALSEDAHAGATYTLTGAEALSFGEAAAIIGKVVGRPIGHRQISSAEFAGILSGAGVPADLAAVVVRNQEAIRDGFGAGITDVVERVTGRRPIQFADYAAGAVGAWALA